MIRRLRGALLGSTGLALVMIAGPALADCQPTNVPGSGQTVTCTGLDTVGVDGSAATQVTVNVLTGATVNPAAAGASIAVGGLSAVNNAGTIINTNGGGGRATGIDLSFGSGSTATNAGSIATSVDSVPFAIALGIASGDANTIVNAGTIQSTVTNSPAGSAIGIGIGVGSGFPVGAGNAIVNNGSIIVTTDGAGAFAFGIALLGGGNVITNNGTIVAVGAGSDEARGLTLFGSNNIVVNTGLIRAASDDCCGIGVELDDSSTVVNRGTIIGIATGVLGTGVGVFSNTNGTITNSGTIIASNANGRAIGVATFSGNTMSNSGTITAATVDGEAFGIQTRTGGGTNTYVNSGTILATASGLGRAGGIQGFFQDTITNSGTIEAMATGGGGSAAVLALVDSVVTNTATGRIIANSPFGVGVLFGATNNTLINQGTIVANGVNGTAVELDNVGNTVINSGLIQALGVGGVAIFNCACGSDSTVVNTSTIDGLIDLSGGVNNVLSNSGLITISTPGVGAAHLISGSFTQTANGTLALRVNAAGGNDSLAVTDTATLGGTLRVVPQSGLYPNTLTYANAITGTIVGTFANVTASSLFLSPSAAYFPTRVDIVLTRIPFGAVPGETQNQRAVANALEQFYSPGASGDAATIYGALFGATSLSVFDQLSGEIGTGVQGPSFAMGSAFLAAVLGQAQRWRTGSLGGSDGSQSAAGTTRVQFAAVNPLSIAQAAPGGTWPPRSIGPRWAAWASGFGLGGSNDGDGSVGSARLGYSMGGGAFGADVEVAPGLLLGGAVGAAGSDFSLDSRVASGTARTVYFGVYGAWTMGPLAVDAALGYGHGQFSTARTIALGAINERATGDFDGNQYGGRIEAGLRFMTGRHELMPFAGVAVQALREDGYREGTTNVTTGLPGILGLSYQSKTTTSVRSFLGGQATTTLRLGEGLRVSPRLRLAWAHEFSNDRQVNASFLTIPGAAFTVAGARPPRDSAIVAAGVDVTLGRNVAVFAQFDGDLASGANAYAGSGGLRISW